MLKHNDINDFFMRKTNGIMFPKKPTSKIYQIIRKLSDTEYECACHTGNCRSSNILEFEIVNISDTNNAISKTENVNIKRLPLNRIEMSKLVGQTTTFNDGSCKLFLSFFIDDNIPYVTAVGKYNQIERMTAEQLMNSADLWKYEEVNEENQVCLK